MPTVLLELLTLMLDFMRRNARSVGIRVALGIIVLVFIFFMGGGGEIGSGPQSLVRVGEIDISRMEYDMAQRRNEAYFRNQFQGQVSEQMLKQLNVPKMTLDQLVDGAVLRSEADRLGLVVTEDAVRDQLMRVPAFQSNGQFSPALYRETIRAQGLTPAQFEETVRQDLLEAQLADVIRRGAHVTEEEAWQDWQRENRRMSLSYVTIDSDKLAADVAVTEEALTKFFEEKQETFRRPPSVKVKYLPYKVADIAPKVEVSDVDLNEYYELNKNSEFQQEEQVAARHILKKVATEAGDDAKKAARDAIDAIRKKLDEGASFEELATAESEDTGSAEKGGDLGFFGRGKMVPAFDAAAFALEKGTVSDIVETDFGYHLIQVYDRKPAGIRPFDEVKDEIRQTIASQKAVDRAFDDSAEDAARIADGTKIEKVAEERGLTIGETTPFSQGDVVPGIGPAPAFATAAFGLMNPGDVSDPVKVGSDYYLVSLVERKESYVPPLAEVREQVESEYREQQAIDLARKKADELLAEAKAGKTLAELAEQNGLEVKTAEDVDGSANFIKEVGSLPGLSEVAFGATKNGEPLARSFVSGSRAFVFVRDSVVEARREDFDAVKKDQIEKLEKAREQEALGEFLQALKAKEEISYDLAQLRPILGESAPVTE
jgi:peptidyl-prolyl cis-trans isomerase D